MDDRLIESADEPSEPGVWRYARAERASVIVDAEDYFRHMQTAMLSAQDQMLLVGWDFDSRIHLTTGRRWWQKGTRQTHPSRLGSFIPWLSRHRRGLKIYILKWGIGLLALLFRGAMSLDLLRWAPRKRIEFKSDSAHPLGGSHHQKVVVIDDNLAVCGGIDMAGGRWDTREHLEHDPARKLPNGKPYGPWHDTTMMMQGPIAKALGDLGRDRWIRAGGKPIPASSASPHDQWPEGLEPQFRDVEIGIARTRAAHRETPQVHEIADLFERQILSAKSFIYAESQYFASRRVAEALCKRLSQPDPPEVVVVHPANADGWLEQQAMDHARVELVRTLGEIDPHNRFNLYIPYVGQTPIYVHAKLMIVDDRIIRVGSANMNNRSMGLDSECDVFIDAGRPGNEHASPAITAIRYSLLAEHCGVEEADVPVLLEQHGSMRAMIKALNDGRVRHLRRFELEETTEVQKQLAESTLLDPERPEDLFEPFARGGLFGRSKRLQKLRDRVKRKAG